MTLPASVRERMGIAPGDTVLLELDGDELRVRSTQASLRRAQAILRQYVPEGANLSDDLITERRREAERETGHATTIDAAVSPQAPSNDGPSSNG